MRRICAIVLIFVLVFALTACGGSAKPNGRYHWGSSLMSASVDTTLVFSGKKVTIIIDSSFTSAMEGYGTFEMDGNTVICNFESGGRKLYTYNTSNDTLSDGERVYTKEK